MPGVVTMGRTPRSTSYQCAEARLAFSDRQVAAYTLPKPLAGLLQPGVIAIGGRHKRVLRPENSVEIPSVERIGFEDVEEVDAPLTIIPCSQTQFEGARVSMGFLFGTVDTSLNQQERHQEQRPARAQTVEPARDARGEFV